MTHPQLPETQKLLGYDGPRLTLKSCSLKAIIEQMELYGALDSKRPYEEPPVRSRDYLDILHPRPDVVKRSELSAIHVGGYPSYHSHAIMPMSHRLLYQRMLKGERFKLNYIDDILISAELDYDVLGPPKQSVAVKIDTSKNRIE